MFTGGWFFNRNHPPNQKNKIFKSFLSGLGGLGSKLTKISTIIRKSLIHENKVQINNIIQKTYKN